MGCSSVDSIWAGYLPGSHGNLYRNCISRQTCSSRKQSMVRSDSMPAVGASYVYMGPIGKKGTCNGLVKV